MKKQSLIKFLLAVLMSMAGAKAFAYDIAAKNADGVTIYYVWANDAKTELAVSYNVRYENTYSDEYSGNVVIPESVTYDGKDYSVTSIGSYAFYLCNNLTSVTIPDCVTSISNYAFAYCIQLTSVNIPDNVISIGDAAYAICNSLTSLNIPNGIKTIGKAAFYGCSGLISITIPSSVTNFERALFQGCTNLSQITIPNSVTIIGDQAFYECSGLTQVTIPNNVTIIGEKAFYKCSGLTQITIPNSVTTIGSSAFEDCNNMTSLVIGTNVTSIGYEAFSGTNLKKTIWLTNTPPFGIINAHAAGIVNYVSNDQFRLSNQKTYRLLSSYFEVDGVRYVPVSLSGSEKTCDAIDLIYGENIKISSTVSYKGIALDLKNINPYFAYNNKYIKTITIDYDGGVPDYAFAGCSNIRSVTFGEKVSDIGNNAFFECSSIEAIKISDETISIGSHAFEKCSSLKEITIGSHVKTINESAFSGCSSLPSITIPHAVTNINNLVFSGCISLKNVIIADSDMELALGVNKFLSHSTTPLFADCPLDTVYIGRDISYNTTSEYDYSPFYRNSSLRAVKIADKETEISENEFYFCTNLKRVIIGDGITSIGKLAFSGC